MPSNYGLDHKKQPNPHHIPRANAEQPGFSQKCYHDMKVYVLNGKEEARIHRNCAIYNNEEKRNACLLYGNAVRQHQTDLYHDLIKTCGPEFNMKDKEKSTSTSKSAGSRSDCRGWMRDTFVL